MVPSSLDATAPLPSAELNSSSCKEGTQKRDGDLLTQTHLLREASDLLLCVCVCLVNLGFCQLPSLPQARGQSLGTDLITLQLSEVLVQPVGPLAH